MKNVKEKTLTVNLTQTELVTLAVFLAGGDQARVDTEDAAYKVNELAPGRFTWRRYRDQINLELVRVYLSDAKKPQKGSLLLGTGRGGWVLTEAGVKWARKVAAQLGNLKLARPRESSRIGSPNESRWRRERERILASPGWIRWERGERVVPLDEARELFRLDSYADDELLEAKIARLTAMFDDDSLISPFLEHLAGVVRNHGGSHD